MSSGTISKPIVFTQDQIDALEAIRHWYKVLYPGGKKFFFLQGAGGTGKTSLIKHVIDKLELNPSQVTLTTFTNKACTVLTEKTKIPSRTIHSLIYVLHHKEYDEERKTEDLIFKPDLDKNVSSQKLIICDECSMVNSEMKDLLLQFGVPVLFIGDTYQLAPVISKKDYAQGIDVYFHKVRPDFELKTIHRQAAGNPIIVLASQFRNHTRVFPTETVYTSNDPDIKGSVRLTRNKSLVYSDLTKYDVILCYTNKVRKAVNFRVRQQLGRVSEFPEVGDRIIFTGTNHRLGVFNSQTGEVTKVCPDPLINIGRIYVKFVDQWGNLTTKDFTYDKLAFTGQGVALPRADKEKASWVGQSLVEFDYGYCITMHKSQGSQFNNVLVIDDCLPLIGRVPGFTVNDYFQALYTAVSRAVIECTYLVVN